jgi:hypothetical protein
MVQHKGALRDTVVGLLAAPLKALSIAMVRNFPFVLSPRSPASAPLVIPLLLLSKLMRSPKRLPIGVLGHGVPHLALHPRASICGIDGSAKQASGASSRTK